MNARNQTQETHPKTGNENESTPSTSDLSTNEAEQSEMFVAGKEVEQRADNPLKKTPPTQPTNTLKSEETSVPILESNIPQIGSLHPKSLPASSHKAMPEISPSTPECQEHTPSQEDGTDAHKNVTDAHKNGTDVHKKDELGEIEAPEVSHLEEPSTSVLPEGEFVITPHHIPLPFPSSPSVRLPKQHQPLPPEQTQGLFGLVELLLKDRTQLFQHIQESRDLANLLPGLLWITLLGSFPIGGILGSYAGGWQIVYASLKIPLLLLLTLAVCFGAFWSWGLYFRTQLHSGQVAALSLSSLAITSILLLGLTPFLWLFIGGKTLYHQAVLGVFTVFFVAGVGGVFVLYQGLKALFPPQTERILGAKTIASIWIGIYGFVGLQMAWILRPYLFHPWANGRPLTFVRSMEGNVYDSLWRTLMTVLGVL